MPLLAPAIRAAKPRSHLARCRRRGISNVPKPQAYLRPLVDTQQDEEFEGVMCLVMDRKEAKNALSVQMVGVSIALHYGKTRSSSLTTE